MGAQLTDCTHNPPNPRLPHLQWCRQMINGAHRAATALSRKLRPMEHMTFDKYTGDCFTRRAITENEALHIILRAISDDRELIGLYEGADDFSVFIDDGSNVRAHIFHYGPK